MGTTRRVLVVDDDPMLCLLMRELLEHDGYTVSTLYSGEHVLAQVGAFQPDVVLLDIMMPPLDGWHVLAELQATHPSLPVIIISALQYARAVYPLRQIALQRGARAWVGKPWGAWEDIAKLIAEPPPPPVLESL